MPHRLRAIACAFSWLVLLAGSAGAQPDEADAAIEQKMQRCEALTPVEPQPQPRRGIRLMSSTASPLHAPTYAEARVPSMPTPPRNTDRYAHYSPNPVHRVAQQSISTFSIDVDTGRYANIRQYLAQGNLPPADAVRLEEVLNYFSYNWAQPAGGQPFAVHTAVVDSPWQRNAKLLRIGLKATDVPPGQLPAANLVFLIDTSGSMAAPNKLDLAQKTVCYFAAHLRAQDTLTLITYSGHTSTLLSPTAGDQFDAIYKALAKLSAEGSTAGGAALAMGYENAEKNFKPNGINRIPIATDGDFNVGVSDTEALKSLVAEKRKGGISLSTLGFGTGNYNDELMEQIADVGDGNYSYIDRPEEAKKVLVRQLSSTLATVARDVKIQVEFNPATVKEYRLVGYENRMLREEDFNNDRVDAGDIGAGHSVTALYEFIPQGATGWLADSRYQPDKNSKDAKNGSDEVASVPAQNTAEYAFIKLRYKPVQDGQGSTDSQLLEHPVPSQSLPLEQADADTRFAIAAAAFAQALKGGQYNGHMDWQSIASLARSSQGADPYGERKEMAELVGAASKLSSNKAKSDK